MKQKAKEVKLVYLNRRQETEIKDHSTMVKHLRKDRVNKMKHVTLSHYCIFDNEIVSVCRNLSLFE